MPRFYYFFESADTEAPLVLPPEAVHHAMRVLRMRQGDAVEVFNGKGCAVNDSFCNGFRRSDSTGSHHAAERT